MARQRGGSWQADVTVAGKRHRQDGFNTEEEANAWEAQVKVAARLGKPIPAATPEVLGKASGITLGAAVRRTIAGVWKGTSSEINSTRNAHAAVKFFGENRPVAEITRSELVKYAAHLKEATANTDATVNRKLASISRVLSYMVEIEELAAAPKLKGVRKKEGEGRLRYLRDEDHEEERILQTFRLWGMDDIADFAIFLIDTGARWKSEGLSLRDERVNWRNGLIVFAGQLTKSGRTRAVPMTDRVRVILDKRRGLGRFFGSITGPQFRHAWDRMKLHIGLAEDDEFVPHCLRHTCASRLVQAGEDLYRVQRWLGHSTIAQTMRYAHLAPKHLMSGAAALNAFNRAKAESQTSLVVVK